MIERRPVITQLHLLFDFIEECFVLPNIDRPAIIEIDSHLQINLVWAVLAIAA
jgi:hypothetical protein